METNTFETLFSTLKTDVKEWVRTKSEWLKLDVFEKSSLLGSMLIYGLIVMNVVFFALLFAFIALGLLFAEWVHNTAGGFALVTLIYLLALIILIVFRKAVIRCLQNVFIKELNHPGHEQK